MPKSDFINVDIKDQRLKAAFATLIERGKHMEPLTEEIANHLYNLTDESFEVESSYTGTPWARLSASTVKQKGNAKMLYHEGTLQRSLYQESTSDSAYVGVNATANGYAYPAVHQFGSKNVPARPYLPFDEKGKVYDTVIDDILGMVGDYLEL